MHTAAVVNHSVRVGVSKLYDNSGKLTGKKNTVNGKLTKLTKFSMEIKSHWALLFMVARFI